MLHLKSNQVGAPDQKIKMKYIKNDESLEKNLEPDMYMDIICLKDMSHAVKLAN